jgi:membrane protein DedA with SNARE-associated domain
LTIAYAYDKLGIDMQNEISNWLTITTTQIIEITSNLIYNPNFGYWGFFLFGLFNFVIPSEPVLIYAGTQVALGKLNFILIVLFALVGSAIKTTIIYSIGYFFGKGFLIKYSKFTHFKEEYLDFVKLRVEKYGYKIVTLIQFIPVVRRYVSAPFGLLRLNYPKFMIFNMLGVLLWFCMLTTIGIFVGKAWEYIKDDIGPFFNYIGLAVVIYLLLLVIKDTILSRKNNN